MKDVTVQKHELLVELRGNHTAHKAIFDEAVAGYKDTVLAELERHIEKVKAGKVRHILVNLPVPENHTKDYDRAIKMIEMSVEDEITLTETDFQAYVMDDWAWKRQFLSSSSAYSAVASTALQENFA